MKLSQSLVAAVICKLLAAFFGWSCKTYLLASARKPLERATAEDAH